MKTHQNLKIQTYYNPNDVIVATTQNQPVTEKEVVALNRCGQYIWFFIVCSFIWAHGVPNWRACEPADSAANRRVQGHHGASGPVETGVDSLKNWPAEQDVYPGIQDLVPGGKAEP